MRTTLSLFLFAVLSSAQAQTTIDAVYDQFRSVPDTTRTKVWWFHGENTTTREGITADLEAYREAGVGGVVYYDQQHGSGAPDAAPAMSSEWWSMLRFAAQEAQRLGLSFEVNISNGYVCGGPWITPDLGMQAVYSKGTIIKGGEHYRALLPSPGRKGEHDIAVLAFPVHKGYHETVSCLPGGFTTDKPVVVPLASFTEPFTARSLSYRSNGYSKAPQSIMNVPCDPQDDFCGNNFTLLPPLGELEVSDDSLHWRTAAKLRPVYRMHSLRPNFTISFPAATGRYFRLNLHDWATDPKQELKIENVELSARAVIDRWEERAAYTSEYIRPTLTPNYQGVGAIVSRDSILNISRHLSADGTLDWTAPTGTDWQVIRFVYAPTRGATKHGRKNLMGLECDKLNAQAAEIHWNHYAQVIIDTLSAIGCKPFGICMDSHEAGSQNWTHDFPTLFREARGYDILPWLPAMLGYIVGSVRDTEQFLSDLRRTIADGISDRYLSTLQRMATRAGVHFTAQAMGNGQSICSDNLAAKGRVERPQGEFWTRMHDGAYDIKEAASAAHLYGKQIASAEAFTDFCYNNTLGSVKDEIDMATVFQVNELVVCASESQPWTSTSPVKINTGYNRDYALNRCNPMWALSKGFWDYQARQSYMMRQGRPVVDILVYAGDETPMKMLAHRLPKIPEGYDFDVCTTDALHHALRLENGQLQSRGGCAYRALAIEKTATVRPETERLIAEWRAAGLPVFDNRQTANDVLEQVLVEAHISPDLQMKSRRSATDRMFFTHRQTTDADIYFVTNHSKNHTFSDNLVMRTDYAEAEWWNALDGSRQRIDTEKTADGLKVQMHLLPGEAGFIVARNKTAKGLERYNPQRAETVSPVDGGWSITFVDADKTIRSDRPTYWTDSADPDIRYNCGPAIYQTIINTKKPRKGERLSLRLAGLQGVAKVKVNGREAGLVWCSPWEADITSLVKNGNNQVEIEVRGSLVNGLVGDAQRPEGERRYWIYTPLYDAKSALVPSGISGDVLLVRSR